MHPVENGGISRITLEPASMGLCDPLPCGRADQALRAIDAEGDVDGVSADHDPGPGLAAPQGGIEGEDDWPIRRLPLTEGEDRAPIGKSCGAGDCLPILDDRGIAECGAAVKAGVMKTIARGVCLEPKPCRADGIRESKRAGFEPDAARGVGIDRRDRDRFGRNPEADRLVVDGEFDRLADTDVKVILREIRPAPVTGRCHRRCGCENQSGKSVTNHLGILVISEIHLSLLRQHQSAPGAP